ncbi:MAG: ATP-binding protein [Polaromonas sp.]|uniref:GAF domain-containing sensor histidine kinase n=1 Tax=Polaromonas sp. TaxID=1869339 RepID=UPI0027192890|nr:ATP-binding protein [Polaromonas sp.]MDO9112589.1 ATP-binding protein [Polaromonas sp.]MDP1887230.1 ATP-binding protein [Polaromonas sp.]
MNPTHTLFTPASTATAADGDPIVSELTTELAAGSDLEPLLERFLVSIVALAGAQAGAVRVLTDDGQYMRLVAQQGLPPHVLSTERLVERDCGMCGIAAGTDVLVWVDDVRSCDRHGSNAYFGLQCKNVLAISLPHGKQVLGIYNLFFEANAQIDPQTQTILRLIGQLLGLALHNARIERERLRVTVMKERQEMLNEVHDAIAQTLAYVKMRLPLLNDALLAHDDQRSLKYFSDVKKAVGDVHDNLREVMTYFRTRMDPLGLLHALHGIADGFLDRTGITLEIRNSAQNLNLTDEQEAQVFHIIQEALANIAKHSMASRAVLAIDKTPRQLEFLIEDDGRGMAELFGGASMAEPAAAAHFGLEIMQGRTQRLGGSLEVGRNEGGGTRVRLVLPANPATGEHAT